MMHHWQPLFAPCILVVLEIVCQTAIPPPSTPAPTLTSAGRVYAWNKLAEIDSGGLKIQIVRVILGERAPIDQPFDNIRAFNDLTVVAALIFKIVNTSSETLFVYPHQARFVVGGGEQIELEEFIPLGAFGDHIGGGIFPGDTKIGGIWFGSKRTRLEGIQNLMISIDAPVNSNFAQVGGDYRFELDLSERKLEPVPPELEFLK